jgi:ABC-type lipoprotein release transport system permease subunit
MIWSNAFRQLTRRPGRSLLSLLSVVIAVGAIVSANVATEVTRAAYKNLFQALTGKADLEVVAKSGGLFREQAAELVRPVSGVRAVVPTIHRFTNLHVGEKKLKVLVTGVDPAQSDSLSGFKLAEGDIPTATDQLAIERELAGTLGLHIGDEVQLRTYTGLQSQKIVGIVTVEDAARLQQGGMVIAPLPTLQRSFRSAGQVTGLQVFLEPNESAAQVIAAAAPLLPPELEVRVPVARTGLADEALALSNNGLNLAGGLAFTTAVFIVLNMFLMNVGERRRELSILRALGATRRQILGTVCFEALVLGIAGTAIGLLVGLQGGHILTASLMTQLQTDLPLASPKWSLLLGAVLGPLICLLAAWYPARLASRVSAIEGMRPRVTLRPRGVRRGTVLLGAVGFVLATVIGIACMLGYAPIWLAIIDVIFGFVSMSLMLPLFLKPGLRLLGWPLQPLLQVEGEISQRLVERYSGRSALTIGVLFISIGAAVAVSNVVFSIADDVRSWYRRTIAVDFLVRTMMPDMTGEETSPMPESLGQELAAVEGVRMIDPVRHVKTSAAGQTGLLVSRDFSLYRELPLAAAEADAPQILRRLRDGEIVLGSVMADKTGLQVGDSIDISVKEATHTFRVAGIVSEYGFGGAIVYIDRATANRAFDLEGVDAYLISADGRAADKLTAALKALTDREGLLLVKGPNLMTGYLHQAERTAEVMKNGWYVSGDLARIDEDGFIYITDRLSRFSKIAGEMVPHMRLEEAINTIVGEACSVVTGVPDEAKGERLVAIYTRQDMAPEALWERLQQTELPRLWLPKRELLVPIDQIPLLGTGKVDLRRVKALALERAGSPTPAGSTTPSRG